MDKLVFSAKIAIAHFSKEEDCYVVAFADDEDDPQNYMVLGFA